MQKINPDYVKLYQYSWDQHDNSLEVKFNIPESISFDQVQIELTHENSCFCGRVEGEIPFFAGLLWEPVESFERIENEENHTILLKITKKNETEWYQIFHGPITDSTIIDPFTSFQLGVLCLKDPEYQISGSQMIGYAAAICFPPALVFSASVASENNKEEEAIKLYKIAAEYHSTQAMFALGMISVKNGDLSAAFEHFQHSAEEGNLDAKICLGELYSPLEEPRIEQENAEKAVQIFQEVLENSPDHPYALLNLARHYKEGSGLPKDVHKAKELYERAKSLNPQIPEISFDDNLYTKLIIGGLALLGIGLIFKFIMRRRK
ncbi:hypothetical protein TRFO_13664 [Tritrichomonas foetus]|uniref:CS domain-containing protein n=1 Tax=Tritrichomonas foetus TaxID=1144522 RepID=A0A1J4KX83_9EUKA|nr:hypothetical protein TRFO_13664 [Tritrichomonas foetus]|eukprot:OHT15847.1 hypothetical protein TRFO_13664 [Tritrichomonas foetus]